MWHELDNLMTETNVNGLQPFFAMEILAEAKKLEAAGRTVCHLEIGEPFRPPAPRVLEAVAAALPEPQRYTHAKGIIELREALSANHKAHYGVLVDPENIIVTMGSSSGFILSFLASFEKNARIAVTRPGYPAYLNILSGLGFEACEIPLSAERNWHLSGADIERAYNKKPFDGLLFASPANPTGAAVTREALEEIIAVCRKLGVQMISDEIYHGLDYTQTSTSATEFSSDVIVVNSFSKYYCMTGWRVGWMILPPHITRRAEMLQQSLFISAPSLSQIAARAALEEIEYSEQQKVHCAHNRDLLTSGLRSLGMENVTAADGAFYTYVDVSKFTNNSMSFCQEMLQQVGVAITPGADFDRVNGHRYVRFSFAGATETIELALEKMAGFLPRPS